MRYVHAVTESTKLDLRDVDTSPPDGLDKEGAREETAKLHQRLAELQELMYGASTHSLLVVLQGMDAGGKDGAINKLSEGLNTQGTSVVSFKVPSTVEAAHDFLWRVHRETPGKGQVTIFNRSHYEEVGIVRVHKLVPEKVWRARYDQINAFEDLLADNRTVIAKFWLHISPDEQKQRLLDREQDPTKAWKLNPGDWEERQLWDEYQAAYSEAIGRCASEKAPWYIVPADAKWFRDLALAHTLVKLMEPLADDWQEALDEVGTAQRVALAAWRKEHGGTA
ncbi:MAG: polyphosphate kinase 2 family protein [Armatimonadetes bacterium]|nr:polyphosphate kinase 2 family protein [Armatimonadota bacterium]